MKNTLGNLILTLDQEAELLTWSRSTSLAHRYVLRAQIILNLYHGETYVSISKNLNVSQPMIAKWKKRFLEHGLLGLDDAKRPGCPRRYSEADRNRVVQKACEKPGNGYSSWSQRRIAQELNMSQYTVCKILQDHELKPHKTEYWCGKSTDPEFEEKMLNVVGLYLQPPDNAIVLCVDEKTQIQALDRSQPELPMKPGLPKRQTTTYKRHGTVSLMAALAVHTGEITAQTIKSNNAETFLKFLKRLNRKYPHKHLHIIADNLSAHKHKDVKEWLSNRKKVSIHYTPTYSSWLNQVEIWFNILTKDVLKGAVWHSKQQLASQIMQYIKNYNTKRAKPFCWTYDGSKNT